MAKTLIDFQNKLIDVTLIKVIERDQKWDDKKEELIYTIEINKDFPESPLVVKFSFSFNNMEHREAQFKVLQEKLSMVEYIVIL